jgi:CRP/FNR family transcriptional regulator
MKCDCENCSLLRGALLAKLPSDQLARLTCVFRLGRYHKNQVVYFEGGAAQHVFALRSGLVKLVKPLENGRDRIVRIVFPGEMFGLEGLTDTTYALAAVTLRDSEICATSPNDLFDFLRQDPEIALGMVRFLVSELGQVRKQVTEMSFKDARTKVATFLLTVACPNSAPASKPSPMTLPFSRQEISEILELSPETISRAFSALRRERLIEAQGRRLTIRDRVGLERVAQR